MEEKTTEEETSVDRLEIEAQRQASIEGFGEELPLVELPLDRDRPPTPSFFREQTSLLLSSGATTELDELAVHAGADRFEVVLAAIAGVIEWLGNQSDIVLGTATADALIDGRTQANGVLLRIDLAEATTIGDVVHAAGAAVRDAARRRDVPLQEVLDLSHSTPAVLRVVVLPDGLPTRLCPEAGNVDDLQDALGEHGATADIVFVVGAGAECEIRADYDGEIFERGSVDALLAAVVRHIEGAHGDASTPLRDIPMLSEDARDVLDGWNRTEVGYPTDRCIHDLIAATAASNPEAIAVRFRDEAITYAQLDQRANALAHLLRARGVGPDAMVGLWVPRSIDMVVGCLAVMKAGGAYVPMDPDYPSSRLAYIREDAGATVVLSRSDVDGAREIAGVILLDETPLDPRTDPPDSGVTSANLAYVIYTSGSTGNPKGVMVEHRQAVNFFAGMDERVGTDRGRWLAVTSLSFDISVLELFWTLARGFEVVIHSVAEEAVSSAVPPGGYDAHDVEFSLFYFGSDDGEVADLTGPDKYRLLMEGATFADENGFVAVWTPERHFHIFGGMFPSPAVAGSALAMVTKNVQIRSGSVVLPLHDPVRIAEEWQLVDNLSGGRVGMSFASGWQPNDFVFRPENYDDRHQVMFDGIETVRDLWRGETRVAAGGDGKDVEFITRPRPVQAELPVWVTAGGAPSTFERAGQVGAHVLTHLLGQSLQELGEKIRIYREAYRAAGHQGTGTVSLMLHTFVGPDLDAVKEVVREPLKDYLKGSVSLFKPFAEALGLDMNNLTPDDEEVLADHAFDRYYDTSGLFGTPESCVERVHQVKALGVDEIACLIDFGIGRHDVLTHLPYLAQLRDRCAETAAPTTGDFSIPGLIRAHDVTHFQCTPSMATMLLADPPSRRALSKLDVMLVGGEAFPLQVAQQLRAEMPQARIVNMYGPTETTIWSSTWELDDLAAGMTIGTPIANTQLHVLDRHGRRVAPGGIGELVIGGDGVTRGYHARPDLTDERFAPDPFIGGGQRMYRTGDMASFRDDGTVTFLGRGDQQVKFRGFRIELGEIEAALCELDTVSEAAVIVHGEGDAKRLIAYLVASPGANTDVTELRNHLKARLTDYMVPTAYIELDALPLTPNKKIDRKALPAPDETNLARTEGAAPANELEALISDIWQEVLKLPSISTSDNFFDLGGHSLLVVHVLNQLRERCDRPVVMTDLFRFPTIASLAAHIGGEHDTAAETAEVSQNRAASRKARMEQRRRRRA